MNDIMIRTIKIYSSTALTSMRKRQIKTRDTQCFHLFEKADASNFVVVKRRGSWAFFYSKLRLFAAVAATPEGSPVQIPRQWDAALGIREKNSVPR